MDTKDSPTPTAPWRGELTAFTPATGWWATYHLRGTIDGRPTTRTYRRKIAGWGTYLAAGRLHILAMVAGDGTDHLIPAEAAGDVGDLWHDGESICDCGNTGGDVLDPWWCPTCAAEIS